MTGHPAWGCDDPRGIHPHWCGFCGVRLLFVAASCCQLMIVPPCPRCGERDWRSEGDELTAPDYREE